MKGLIDATNKAKHILSLSSLFFCVSLLIEVLIIYNFQHDPNKDKKGDVVSERVFYVHIQAAKPVCSDSSLDKLW